MLVYVLKSWKHLMKIDLKRNNGWNAIKLAFLEPSNKSFRPRLFKKGDLVLTVRRHIITTHQMRNKFTSKWDGPYVIQEVYSNGAYKLITGDGLRIGPINGNFFKQYYL